MSAIEIDLSGAAISELQLTIVKTSNEPAGAELLLSDAMRSGQTVRICGSAFRVCEARFEHRRVGLDTSIITHSFDLRGTLAR